MHVTITLPSGLVGSEMRVLKEPPWQVLLDVVLGQEFDATGSIHFWNKKVIPFIHHVTAPPSDVVQKQVFRSPVHKSQFMLELPPDTSPKTDYLFLEISTVCFSIGNMTKNSN